LSSSIPDLSSKKKKKGRKKKGGEEGKGRTVSPLIPFSFIREKKKERRGGVDTVRQLPPQRESAWGPDQDGGEKGKGGGEGKKKALVPLFIKDAGFRKVEEGKERGGGGRGREKKGRTRRVFSTADSIKRNCDLAREVRRWGGRRARRCAAFLLQWEGGHFTLRCHGEEEKGRKGIIRVRKEFFLGELPRARETDLRKERGRGGKSRFFLYKKGEERGHLSEHF